MTEPDEGRKRAAEQDLGKGIDLLSLQYIFGNDDDDNNDSDETIVRGD